jgi:hypothetical protein
MTQQLVNRMGELFKHTNWFDPAQSDLHRRHHLTPGLYFPEKYSHDINCKLTNAIIATMGGAQLQPSQLSLGYQKLTSFQQHVMVRECACKWEGPNVVEKGKMHHIS